MDVYPCSKSKARDEGKTNMTPYADDDEECLDEEAFPDHLDEFRVSITLVSDTFNPYSYH